MEIRIGGYAELIKGSTIVSGLVNGIKVKDGELERVSIEELDWFVLEDGWAFVMESEMDDAEV
jgi:hypothetical protein